MRRAFNAPPGPVRLPRAGGNVISLSLSIYIYNIYNAGILNIMRRSFNAPPGPVRLPRAGQYNTCIIKTYIMYCNMYCM